MIYGSVCSGIEAATAAWHPLGWKPAWFSEIEPFPSAVLAHHYPEVPNLGDMTLLTGNEVFRAAAIDLLVGGTPCQAFSVAGLRAGLADPRGNLALEFLRLADAARPRWLVWENVPGVLSSNGGRDFGAFLAALGQLGYGWAYRSLDAQFFGLAQRRRRVFVVAHLGDWRRAAAVLLEREGLRGDPPPRRPTRARAAAGSLAGARAGGGDGQPGRDGGGRDPVVAAALTGSQQRQDGLVETLIPDVTHTLRAHGFDASEDGAGRGTPLVPDVVGAITANGSKNAAWRAGPDEAHAGQLIVSALTASDGGVDDNTAQAGHLVAGPIPFDPTQITHPENRSNPQPDGPCHTLPANGAPPTIAYEAEPTAFRPTGGTHGVEALEGLSPALKVGTSSGGGSPPAIVFDGVGEWPCPELADPITANEAKTYTHEGNTFRLRNVVPAELPIPTLGAQPVDLQNGRVGGDVVGTLDTTEPSKGGGQAVMVPDDRPIAVCNGSDPFTSVDLAMPVTARHGDPGTVLEPEGVTIHGSDRTVRAASYADVALALRARAPGQVENSSTTAVHAAMGVRRLTPRECERLQGFPDDFTLIPWKGGRLVLEQGGVKVRELCPDGPRYKALGNSMAVPVMRWIGERIALVDQLALEGKL